MMNKKGMELTMTILVLLVISLIVFGSSVYLLRQIYKGTEDISNTIDQRTESELRGLLAGGQIVAFPENSQSARAKKASTYWIGIKNLLGATEDFGVQVSFSKAFDFNQNEILTEPDYIESTWLFAGGLDGPFSVDNNEQIFRDIVIVPQTKVGVNMKAPNGLYFFNVCVFNASRGIQSLQRCDDTLLATPGVLYPPGKVFSLRLELE